MADRYDDRYRGDRYRGERGYRREERGLPERAGDEVRSWFGDEEAERRRRVDELERERSRGYRPEGEQEWGDYAYRGETWRDREARGWGMEPDWRGGAGAGRAYGGADYGRRDYGPVPGEAGLSRYGYGKDAYSRRGEYTGRGPKGYQRSDSRINEDVCDRLADAPDIDASDIEVRTANGEVTLSGSVRERSDKRRAEDLIENVSGVREVHNALRLNRFPDATTARTVTPATASARPRAAMSAAGRTRR